MVDGGVVWFPALKLVKPLFCLYALQIGLPIVYPADKNLPTKQLTLTSGVVLKFGEKGGEGKNAQVYPIVDPAADIPLVVKFARTQAGYSAIEREWAFYQLFEDERPSFIIPILNAPMTRERGLVLIKPLVVGEPLRDIVLQKGALTKEQVVSLKKIQAWAPTFQRLTTRPLDLNPTNLVWVTDPATLSLLGLEEPSFALYEVARTGDLDTPIYNWLFYDPLLSEHR